ncbi:MAG: hypothetical protein K2O36_00045, partial [Ruminococcus sp.]|nr:hypothetical protein [Ruminococcus sp.]
GTSAVNGTLGTEYRNSDYCKKKSNPTDREMTTPLFLLRCVELGIALSELDLLTVGLVNDMFIEKSNDDFKYNKLATQDDFDKF